MHGAVFSSHRLSQSPRSGRRRHDLQRAAEVLNAGEKVAMLIGQGAAQRRRRGVEAAELLGAGVAKALNGRAALPDDLPFVTGSIGLLGTKPSHEMMMNCDTLLMVGSSFPYAEWLPEEGSGARRCRSTSTAGCWACATRRRRSTWSATPRRHAARADPAPGAQGGPLLARGDRARDRALVEDPRRARAA